MGVENQPIEDFDFAGKLDWLAFHMANYGRNSTFDLAQYFPEQIQTTQRELVQYAGKVITGNTSLNEYYIAGGPGSDDHSVGKLEYNRFKTEYGRYKFAGILQDLQDIHVTMPPLADFKRAGNILCISIAPIGNQPTQRLTDFYEHSRRHPFAEDEHAGKPIWVPVRYLQTGSVKFVDLESEIV